MRGRCDPQLSLLAFVDLDARNPAGHPPRVGGHQSRSVIFSLLSPR